MKDADTVKQFLDTIPHYYAIPNPLLLAYTTINYTNKSDFPQEPELITEVNFTLLISTSKELIIAARALREFYHFYTIPSEWIKIPEKTSDPLISNKQIPKSNEEINTFISTKDPQSTIHFPITDQEDILAAIQLLQQYFKFNNLPNFIFSIQDLPPP